MQKEMISFILGLLISTFFSTSAFAVCAFCDKVIVLDSALATCFQQHAEVSVEKISHSKRMYLPINLGPCMKADAQGRNLDTMADPTIKINLKSNFILDIDSVNCVVQTLKNYSGTFDPRVEIDLIEDCS